MILRILAWYIVCGVFVSALIDRSFREAALTLAVAALAVTFIDESRGT